MKTCEKLNKISQKDKVMRFLKELFAPVFQGTFCDVSLIHFFEIAEEFKKFFRKKTNVLNTLLKLINNVFQRQVLMKLSRKQFYSYGNV